MQFRHKMKLFLNDPSFKRREIDGTKPQQPKQLIYRSMFPTKLQMQRFRHLQQARVNTIQDMNLDRNAEHSILKLQQVLRLFHSKDKELQTKRQSFFGKFKMDYVQGQMNQNLNDLQKLIHRHEQLHDLIKQQKRAIQKVTHLSKDINQSLKMTEIKKALKIQNQLLKGQNEKLKEEERRLDNYIVNLKR